MFFLLRMAFWLSVILVLLPSFVTKEVQHTPIENSRVNAGDAVSAASATVSDLRQFCSRQPDACAIGAQAATAFGQKAQAGARILYDYLQDQINPKETGSVGNAPARSANAVENKSASAVRSRDTLMPADLAPAGHVPMPRPAPPARNSA